MIPIKNVMSLSKGDIDRELIGHVNTVGHVTSRYMGVPLNGGTPKWMVYNGKPY